MNLVATFDVSAAPEAVAAYLSKPRNLFVGNHEGPVVDRSEAMARAGSWAVLEFDQLKVRVEYTVFDPPTRIRADIAYSGWGSRGLTGTADYRLVRISGSGGTRVRLEMSSSGGRLTEWLSRLTWPLLWRRYHARMDRWTT